LGVFKKEILKEMGGGGKGKGFKPPIGLLLRITDNIILKKMGEFKGSRTKFTFIYVRLPSAKLV